MPGPQSIIDIVTCLESQLDRQIAATDQQIDTLVYQIYDLTPEKIKIVEKTE